MTPSAYSMVNYRKGGGVVKIPGNRVMPIKGTVNVPMSFWSGMDWMQLILPNVAHVPLLGCNFLSLKMIADCGHKYVE